jgi:hypothetical protein
MKDENGRIKKRQLEQGQSQLLDQQKRAEEWQDFDERLVHQGKVRRFIVEKYTLGYSAIYSILIHNILFYIYVWDKVHSLDNFIDYGFPWFLAEIGFKIYPLILVGYASVGLFGYLVYRHFKNKTDLIKLRVLAGLRNFKIKNLKGNRVNFELEDGKELDEDQIMRALPILAKQLGFQSGEFEFKKTKRGKRAKGSIVLAEKLPNKDEAMGGEVSSPSKKCLKDNCFLIGVNDKNATPIYTTETTDKGRFQQHGLVVGGSGSGKSYFITNTLMSNFFDTKEHFLEYSHIKIIDFKGSGDYAEFEGYPNVEVLDGDPKRVLSAFKDVEIERMARERYMRDNGLTTGDIPKYIFLIDEAQTIAENMSSKQSRIYTNTWNNINQLLTTLTAKARSANITVIVCLQKATAENISTTVRQNIAHRFCMKNDNMELLINDEVMDRMGIKPKQMEQGQFYYSDTITGGGLIKPCFAVPMPRMSIEDVSKIKDSNIDFKNELKSYKQNAVNKFVEDEETMRILEEEGAIDLSSDHKNYLDQVDQDIDRQEYEVMKDLGSDFNKEVEMKDDFTNVMSMDDGLESGFVSKKDLAFDSPYSDSFSLSLDKRDTNPFQKVEKFEPLKEYGIPLILAMKDIDNANKHFKGLGMNFEVRGENVFEIGSDSVYKIEDVVVDFPISNEHLLRMGIIKEGTILELELERELADIGLDRSELKESLLEFEEKAGLDDKFDWSQNLMNKEIEL